MWKRPGQESWTPSFCTRDLHGGCVSQVRALLHRSNRCAAQCVVPRFFLSAVCGCGCIMYKQSDAQKRSTWFVDQPGTLDGLKMMFNAQQNMTSQHKFLGGF